MNKKVEVIRLGLVDYQKAKDFQESLFNAISDIKIANRTAAEPKQTPNYLIICQHPPVYTMGKSGKEEHILFNNEKLLEIGAEYHKINRGGDITHHGPGQLVAYPILDLDNFFTDIHKYMRYLEETVIKTIAEYGINAGRHSGETGVWIDNRKICAMGVRAGRWITMHGLALNVINNLDYFNYIVPCGITDKEVTSINKETGLEPSVDEVAELLIEMFAEVFECELTKITSPVAAI